ncbi:MAG: hypothetical protein HQ562_06540 [Candidatus Marinimicrobia bacterium]|nr:hypothetical protein [Candidatus Neomarinimicrobiota bacterium]
MFKISITRFNRLILGILLALTSSIWAQAITVSINHPINKFISQQVVKNNLPSSLISKRPIQLNQIHQALDELKRNSNTLSKTERLIVQRFRAEFGYPAPTNKPEFITSGQPKPVVIKSDLLVYTSDHWEPHILSYNDQDLALWGDFIETINHQTGKAGNYLAYQDGFQLAGFTKSGLSFYSKYTQNRFMGSSQQYLQSQVYFNELSNFFDQAQATIWYQTEASLLYSTKDFEFGWSKTPIYWGFSSNHSPILSANVQPIAHLKANYSNDKLNFSFINGSLLPFNSNTIHDSSYSAVKRITAHRLEIALNDKWTVSFTELLIYGHRASEISYMIPTLWFWAEEHNLGDRDNVLLACDSYYKYRPGLAFYQSLLIDELSWSKLFKDWWGNKFVLQLGLHWIPTTLKSTMDIRIEATVARPWVYTHEDSLNNFTSAELGLGFPLGPNCQTIYLETNWWYSHRGILSLELLYKLSGSGLGSDPNDDYDFRDESLDFDTPYILGTRSTEVIAGLNNRYKFSRMVEFYNLLEYNSQTRSFRLETGIKIDI